MRPGEKLHEELISQYDSNDTVDHGNYYIKNRIIIMIQILTIIKKKLKSVNKNFVYSSNINNKFLSIKRS